MLSYYYTITLLYYQIIKLYWNKSSPAEVPLLPPCPHWGSPVFDFIQLHKELETKHVEIKWNVGNREQGKFTCRIVEGRLEFAKGSARWGISDFLCKKLCLSGFLGPQPWHYLICFWGPHLLSSLSDILPIGLPWYIYNYLILQRMFCIGWWIQLVIIGSQLPDCLR